MEPRACVLVTDGDQRAALAVTRGLGQAGIAVVVGAETAQSLAGASRYCAARCVYPSPLSDAQGFFSALADAVERFGVTDIVPVTDSAMQLLVERSARLPAALARSLPSKESYDLLSDKYRLMELAREKGVPIPETLFVPDGTIESVIEQVAEYPVVVKPGRSLQKVNDRWVKTTVHTAANREELIRLYQLHPYLRNPSLIQRRIIGEGQGVVALFEHGRPCALFAHKRIREKPPSGGVSVLRESIQLPKPMTDYAISLLEHVKWHGVAMVEFKVGRDSGVPMLMEVNGRFWGSLQLALDAGLNFPYLLHRMGRGARLVAADHPYRVGTKSRWFLGDVDHLLMRLTKSREELRLDATAPSRWRSLLDFCNLFQHDLHCEVERLSDPGPALVEYRAWLGQLLGGRT